MATDNDLLWAARVMGMSSDALEKLAKETVREYYRHDKLRSPKKRNYECLLCGELVTPDAEDMLEHLAQVQKYPEENCSKKTIEIMPREEKVLEARK